MNLYEAIKKNINESIDYDSIELSDEQKGMLNDIDKLVDELLSTYKKLYDYALKVYDIHDFDEPTDISDGIYPDKYEKSTIVHTTKDDITSKFNNTQKILNLPVFGDNLEKFEDFLFGDSSNFNDETIAHREFYNDPEDFNKGKKLNGKYAAEANKLIARIESLEKLLISKLNKIKQLGSFK